MPKPKIHQLHQSDATDGQAPVWDQTAFSGAGEWSPGTVVRSIVPGSNITVNNADPAHPVVSATEGGGLVPLTTEIGGEPSLVWDDDNQLVMTEAP